MTQAQAIAAAVAAVLANQVAPKTKTRKAKGAKREKLTDEQKAVNAKLNADVAVKLFEDAGYKNCVAHETIKTYDKWVEAGRRVMKGQKAIRTPKGVALFHLDQTEAIAALAN